MDNWKIVKLLLTISLMYGLLKAPIALALPYTFHLDHFVLNGNQPASVTDDFNDDNLNPALWEIYDPSVTESGSTVSFQNPGTQGYTQLGALSVAYEMSYIHSHFMVEDGSGDYSVTTTWVPTIPGLNQFYVMNVSASEGAAAGMDENILMGVANFDSDISNFFGTAPGPAVFFGRTFDSAVNPVMQGYAITQEDLTGDLLLNMTFNDAMNEYSSAFSLDGGASFLTPFGTIAPMTAAHLNQAEVTLGAESWQVVPVPPALLLMLSGLLPLFAMRSMKRSKSANERE